MAFVLNHTKIGRYTIAIGSNKEATVLSGINVKFYHIMAYVISGFFAGLAAIAYSAVFSTVQPGTGAGFERRRGKRCGFPDWRICYLSVKDRTPLHWTSGELAADYHRTCTYRSGSD